MAKDVPSIPMFVRPVFAISREEDEGHDDPHHARGEPLERELLDDS